MKEIEMANSGEGSSHVDLEQGRPQGVQAPSENEINEHRLELGSGRVSAATLKNKIMERMPAATASNSRRPSIWRVPSVLRNEDANAYEPQVVSIGPLHQGKSELLPMEEFKLEILCQLLNGKPDNTLDIFLGEVSGCLPNARDEYAEKIELSDDEFAEMLVIDGCFVVAHFSIYCFLLGLENIPSYWSMFLRQGEIGIHAMTRDLLLLENQIPFFAVNKLYQKIVDMFPRQKSEFPDLTSLFLSTFGTRLPREKYPEEKQIKHLLHLLCLSHDPELISDYTVQRSRRQQTTTLMNKVMGIIFVPVLGMVYLILFRDWSALIGGSKLRQFSEPSFTIPSATELHEAGVTFKKKAVPFKLKEFYGPDKLKVSFRDGTFEIPWFLVADSTCRSLRNLIAYEQREFFFGIPHVTHYCALLDGLINTAEDVGILRRSGILENIMGSDSEVAEMFNGLCKNVHINSERSYYKVLYKDLMKFVEVPHHKWRANLVHTYFRNPWTVFSFMAALVLVASAVTQTMVTIYPRKQS